MIMQKMGKQAFLILVIAIAFMTLGSSTLHFRGEKMKMKSLKVDTRGWNCNEEDCRINNKVDCEKVSCGAWGNDDCKWIDFECFPKNQEERGKMERPEERREKQRVHAGRFNAGKWAETEITAMQWSPHHTCVGGNDDTCAETVFDMLEEFQKDYKFDFLNVGMMDDAYDDLNFINNGGNLARYEQFQGFKCGRDKVDLWYNTEIWRVEKSIGAKEEEDDDDGEGRGFGKNSAYETGCLQDDQKIDKNTGEKYIHDDRAYISAVFHRRSNPRDRVLVYGVHMPHPIDGTSSGNAIFDNYGMENLGELVNSNIYSLAETEEERKRIKVLIIGDFNYDAPQTKDFPGTGRSNGAPAYRARPLDSTERGRWTPTGLTMVNWAEATVSSMQPVMSSERLWKKMHLKYSPKLVSKTEDSPTCCADQHLPANPQCEKWGNEAEADVFFPFAFDRILSSFGSKIITFLPMGKYKFGQTNNNRNEILFKGAFHKPIVGKIIYKPT